MNPRSVVYVSLSILKFDRKFFQELIFFFFFLIIQDEDGCCSSQFYPKAAASKIASGELTDQNNGSSSSISFRPLKLQRENAFIPSGKAVNEDQTEKMKSRRAAIIGSLRKFQQEIESSAMITVLSKLSRD